MDRLAAGASLETFGGAKFVDEPDSILAVSGTGFFEAQKAFDQWYWANSGGKLPVQDRKEPHCRCIRGDSGPVIPAASFLKVSADIGVAVGSVISGENRFQDDLVRALRDQSIASCYKGLSKMDRLRSGGTTMRQSAGSQLRTVPEIDRKNG